MTPNDIVTMREVAGTLKANLGETSPEDLGAAIGVEGMTIRRWLDTSPKGTEGKCTQVARAGAALGLSPNELFLKVAPMKREGLREDDIEYLQALLIELARARELCAEGESPVKIVAEFLRRWNKRQSTNHPGLLVENPEPNVVTIKPTGRSSPGEVARKLRKTK